MFSYKLFILSLFSFVVFITNGQTLTPPSPAEVKNAPKWAQLLYADNPNYFQVEKAYQAYYKTHEFKKDNHVRYYRFWKKLFKNHVDESGYVNLNLPTKKRMSASSQNCYGNWSVVGPMQMFDVNGNPSRSHANVYCIDQAKTDTNILFCGTESGEIYKSVNHGETWFNVSLDLEYNGSYRNVGVRAIAIHPTNPNIVYFSANQLIGKSINGGQTWEYVYTHGSSWYDFNAEKIVFHPLNANIIYVATKKGLLKSNNAGSTWTTVFNQPTYDICFKPSSPQTIYVLRKNPLTNLHEFVKSTDNGVTFQTITTGWYTSSDPDRQTIGGRIAVTEANSNFVYAYLIGDSKAGDAGYIGVYKSTDSGSSWTLPNGPVGGPYSATHPNLANALPLGTGHHQGFYNCALLVSPTNANHILIGSGSIWKSEDGGSTFTSLGGYVGGILDDAIHVGAFHVDMQEFKQAGNTTWVTTDGGIYRSTDFFSSATNFAKKDHGVHSTDIWGLGQGWNEDVLYAGAYHNGNVSFYENWGQGNTLNLGGGEPATGYVNPGENRLVYSSTVDGRILPLQIGDPVKETFFGIQPNEMYWPLDEFSELEFHPSSFRVAYTGKDHQLWKTTDKAETFHILHSFGTNSEDKITFIEISRKNPDIIYVAQQHSASYSSSLHKTTDGGVTWTTINLPVESISSKKIALQVDPFNPDHIWVGFNYWGNTCKVFTSSNGGATWTDLTTATIANEQLNTLTFIPGTNNGVYVGTDGIMYYKNDNLSDWICFSNDLPPLTITFHAKPFYRDGKLRIATVKGIWESPLYQEPSRPFAQASVNKLTSYASVCVKDTLHFVDHSILNHENATWEWSFGSDAMPSTSSHWQEKVVFNSTGTHSIILKITDQYGYVDRDTLEIEVLESPSIDEEFAEDFENGIPTTGVRLINQDSDNISWYINDSIGGFGLSNHCLAIDGFSASNGGVDDLEFDINLEYIDSPMVTFDLAYAFYGNAYTDTLEVLISTDCGETYQTLYFKGGSNLATVQDIHDPFFPEFNQWRTDTVNLFAYGSSGQALLVFRDHQGWGQNMFLDNINLSGEELPNNVGVDNEITPQIDLGLYPNPTRLNQSIFIDGPEDWNYTFELYSSQGKKVYTVFDVKEKQIKLPNVSKGTYAYRITSDTLIKHGVLVVK